MEVNYSGQDYLDVQADDGVRVSQSADNEYTIHQFKDFVGDNTSWSVEWNGQTNYAPSSSPVVLQIYNYNTPGWENLDTESTAGADTDFTLTGQISVNPDYYKLGGVITCRVYQDGGA